MRHRFPQIVVCAIKPLFRRLLRARKPASDGRPIWRPRAFPSANSGHLGDEICHFSTIAGRLSLNLDPYSSARMTGFCLVNRNILLRSPDPGRSGLSATRSAPDPKRSLSVR